MGLWKGLTNLPKVETFLFQQICVAMDMTPHISLYAYTLAAPVESEKGHAYYFGAPSGNPLVGIFVEMEFVA